MRNDDKWKCLENMTEVTETKPEPAFPFETNCFLCQKIWDHHKPGRQVCTPRAQECIEKAITARNDEWSEQVQRTIQNKCLLEEKARYHIACYEKFRYKPKDNSEPGRRVPGLDAAFEDLCRYMEESGECQFTYKKLLDKMEGWTTTPNTLKQKLIKKYGSEIVFVERPPKPTVICFRNTGFKFWRSFGMRKRPRTMRMKDAALFVLLLLSSVRTSGPRYTTLHVIHPPKNCFKI